MSVTERDVLDALHRRYCRPVDTYRPQRYILAEHVPDRMWGGRANRIIDAIAIDCWRGTYASGSDSSIGHGIEGFEVKISKSDLRRELADLTKSGRFTDGIDHLGPAILTEYTIVAPTKVVDGWRTLGIPAGWGVMALADDGTLRYLRKPTRLSDTLTLGIGTVACIARAIAKTTAKHCARIHPEETHHA